MLHPCEVGIACWWYAILPTPVVLQFVSSPVAEIEGRVSHYEVSLQEWVLVFEEGVGIALAEVGFQSANCHIHVSHLPCGGVSLLTIDTDA